MLVRCQQKYVMEQSGQTEVVRILIPTGLSRSVFPLEFDIEPDGYSLTPDGDALPVTYGTSIIPDNEKPSYYFVKSLTEDAYKALPTTLENGVTWKVIDCHFKTTIAQNECTVYVYNRYFTEASSNDDFHNFVQRLFTTSGGNETLTFPATVYRHGNATLEFVLDYAHRNNTHVWWDPTNSLGQSDSATQAVEKGLSTSNRVLPPIFTVELLGFTPQYEADGETPVTLGLTHLSGNKYSYNVGTGTPTSDMATVTLALTASGAVGSTATVKLSTANLTENPNLYKMNSVSSTIQGASFSGVGDITIELGLNKTGTFSFNYVDGIIQPVTVSLTNLTLDTSDTRITDNGDGTFTFTPNNSNISQSFTVKTTTRFTSGTISLAAEDYNAANASANRPTSLTLPSGTSLVAGARRPYYNYTYAYAYYTDNYTNTYRVSSNGYQTRFNTSNPYASRDNIIIDLTKYGNNVEDGVVYFQYYSYEEGQVNYANHYAQAPLADIIDALDAGDKYTLNFKIWTTTNVTFTASSDNYQWPGVIWTVSDNPLISMYFTNNSGVKNNNNYYVQIGTTSAAGTIFITTEGSVYDGIKLTGATITYRNNYNGRTVSSSPGSISNQKRTWTASASGDGKGDDAVTITMASGNTPNQISSIQINYGYWD